MRNGAFVFLLILAAASAFAQDVLTIGSTAWPAGQTVEIPIYLRDAAGTTLGTDAGAGKRISSFAFKIVFSPAQIAAASLIGEGVASGSPLFQRQLNGPGYVSEVVTFTEAIPLALSLNAVPGNRIARLTVTLQPGLPNGTVIPLAFDAPQVMLASESLADRETIALGNLVLVNGSVTVSAVPAPASIDAAAAGTSQVNVTWAAVGVADHYEVWRSFNAGDYVLVNSPAGTSYPDASVSANTTYLYRVRAVNAAGDRSPFASAFATTIGFTDDPLNGVIVKAVHLTEVETAINAVRAAIGLSPLAANPTIGVGQVVRLSHITSLRANLNEVCRVIGIGCPPLHNPVAAAGGIVRAVHVHDLRDAVR